MDFRDQANLDASQVEERSGGRSRIPGGGLAVGGGITGIIALIAALVFGINPGNITGNDPEGIQPTTNLSEECRTGADADQSEKCRVVGVVNSIQEYWDGLDDYYYQQAKTVLFAQATNTGCGAADSSVGPFYCPRDQQVYLDLSFFDLLQSRFGAEGGPFAQAYVIAHEYGHHVQYLAGQLGRIGQDRQGADSGSVKLELQADCYAGVWAKHAVETGFYERPFTRSDIQQALDAAAAVGDDRIQERTQGMIDPEAFTHGTARQRVTWFTTGYETGSPDQCNTFRKGI
ncbi:neutral zinc metallopeptidase [Nonomuraea sp. NPDC059194]|uniref:KPN_02809 family neutral zinc metallopeptidase n=1 Tax=Nonomuraea sp. NPDC059194 TaxID=3346764 RepID=UPI00368CAADF